MNTYSYDSANRLRMVNGPSSMVSYAYNGMNDRLQETVNGTTTTFTMDLNTGLTQALSDGTNHYIYGVDRIAQVNVTTEYFLGDALGSVRQLTDVNAEITYASAYDPYGVTTSTSGASQSAYGYTNEYTSQGLVYLRARYYSTGTGRFLTRDTWMGDYQNPSTLNAWNYTSSNPVNYIDPSGHFAVNCEVLAEDSCGLKLVWNGWLLTLVYIPCDIRNTLQPFVHATPTTTPQPYTPTSGPIQTTPTPQDGTPTPKPTETKKGLTSDERINLNKILNFDVLDWMLSHPDAPREATGWKHPSGKNHYRETLQVLTGLANSVGVLQRVLPLPNRTESAKQEALNGINQGRLKIAVITNWLYSYQEK